MAKNKASKSNSKELRVPEHPIPGSLNAVCQVEELRRAGAAVPFVLRLGQYEIDLSSLLTHLSIPITPEEEAARKASGLTCTHSVGLSFGTGYSFPISRRGKRTMTLENARDMLIRSNEKRRARLYEAGVKRERATKDKAKAERSRVWGEAKFKG